MRSQDKVPFFSLVLPTRNRPQLAAEIIRYTLAVSFRDFELVVVDNGDDEVTSQEALKLGDPRVRTVRTGGLTMHDNWQAGFDAARGRFVLMIEDKLFLVKDGLQQVAGLLKEGGWKLVTWTNATCAGRECGSLQAVGSVTTEEIPARRIMEYGASGMVDYYQKQAPRALNMAVDREFACGVQARVGRLFRPMAPDYSMGALLLPFLEKFLHCHQTLSRPLRGGPSTGAAVGKRTPEAEVFLNGLGISREELFREVPVKTPFFSNLIVADLMRFWRDAGVGADRLPLNLDGYFLMLLSELLLAERDGAPTRDETAAFRQAFSQRSLGARLRFLLYAVKRFQMGWPDRRAKMRANMRGFLRALAILHGRPASL